MLDSIVPFLRDLEDNADRARQLVTCLLQKRLDPAQHVVLWGAPGTSVYAMIMRCAVAQHPEIAGMPPMPGSAGMLLPRADALVAMRGVADIEPMLAMDFPPDVLPWLVALPDGLCCLSIPVVVSARAAINAPGGSA